MCIRNLIIAIAVLGVCGSSHEHDMLLIKTSVNEDTELLAQRSSNAVSRANVDGSLRVHDMVDSVEVHLRSSDEPMVVWQKEHVSEGHSVDVYGTISAQASLRLVLYDAVYDDGVVWVLYSLKSRVYLDRVEATDDGPHEVSDRVEIIEQVNSAVTPYLIESGVVFRHDDVVHIGLKTFGSSSAPRGRDHPYEFWKIEGGSAIEIEVATTVGVLRQKMASILDDQGRPRMSEQIKPPKVDQVN